MKKLLFMALVGFTLAAAPLTTNQQALVKALRKSSEVLKNMAAGSTGLTDEAIIQHLENYITKNITTDPAAIKKIEANLAHAFSDDKATSALSYKDMFDVYEVADFFHIPIVLEKTAAPKKLIDELKSNSKVLKDMEGGSYDILTDRDILTYLDTQISHNLGITDPIEITKVESNLASLLAGNIDASTLTYHDAVDLYDITDYLNIPESTLQPLQERLISEFAHQAVDRIPQSETALKSALEAVIKTQSSEFITLIEDFHVIKNQMMDLIEQTYKPLFLNKDAYGQVELPAKTQFDAQKKTLTAKWQEYQDKINNMIKTVTNVTQSIVSQHKEIDQTNIKEHIEAAMISPMIEQLIPVFDRVEEFSNKFARMQDTSDLFETGAGFLLPVLGQVTFIMALIEEFIDFIKAKLGLPITFSRTSTAAQEGFDRVQEIGDKLTGMVEDIKTFRQSLQKEATTPSVENNRSKQAIASENEEEEPIEIKPVDTRAHAITGSTTTDSKPADITSHISRGIEVGTNREPKEVKVNEPGILEK